MLVFTEEHGAALPIVPLRPTLSHDGPLCLGQNSFGAGMGELLLVGAVDRQDHRPVLRAECYRFVDGLPGSESVREPAGEAIAAAFPVRDRPGYRRRRERPAGTNPAPQ